VSTPDSRDIVGPVTAHDSSTGSVILRGVRMALNTDVGQTFVADCARHTEGLVSDHDIRAKWKLTQEDWAGLATNTLLLDAVKTERERRIFNGVAAREGAQRHFSKAPSVLSDILTDEQVPPRHRIEAARELRQAAGNGPDPASVPGEKFVITINLGAKQLRFEETIAPLEPSPSDDGDIP
jgi:hypothetical protein